MFRCDLDPETGVGSLRMQLYESRTTGHPAEAAASRSRRSEFTATSA